MTRLDARALALAAGGVMAALYSLCTLWVAVSPQGFMSTIGYLTHIDLTPLARSITWTSFLAGLVAWSVATAVTFGAIAWDGP